MARSTHNQIYTLPSHRLEIDHNSRINHSSPTFSARSWT